MITRILLSIAFAVFLWSLLEAFKRIDDARQARRVKVEARFEARKRAIRNRGGW